MDICTGDQRDQWYKEDKNEDFRTFCKSAEDEELRLSSTIGEETADLGQLLANELDSTAAPVGFGDFDSKLFDTPKTAYCGAVPTGNFLQGFDQLWSGEDDGHLPVTPPLDLSHLGAAANPSIDVDDWLPDYKVPDVNATRKYTPPPRNNRNRVFFPIGPAALDRKMPANARNAILQDARETELSRLRRQAFLLTGKEAIMRNFIAHNELYAERRIANFEQLYIQVEAHLENPKQYDLPPGFTHFEALPKISEMTELQLREEIRCRGRTDLLKLPPFEERPPVPSGGASSDKVVRLRGGYIFMG